MREREGPDAENDASLRVNPGYAGSQLARALATSHEHADAATRERARERAARWASVLEGLLAGTLDAGSRTPLSGVPVWATLKVATGGFATGELLAGGPLLPHEQELLRTRALGESPEGRRELNRYFLTEEGLLELQEWLRSGCYHLEVPEEGALLVAAWLVREGHTEKARDLLEILAPFFPLLRFYPQPAERSLSSGTQVHVRDVGEAIQSLGAVVPNRRIQVQKEAAEVWAPLYDEVVRLFLETVEGDPPVLLPPGAAREDGGPTGEVIAGGWPCRWFPAGWKARAQDLLREYERQRRAHPLSDKPERKGETFAELRRFLARCADDSASLSGREIGRIRQLLARAVAKRGVPGSPEHRRRRQSEAAAVAGILHSDLAGLLVPRLAALPPREGIAAESFHALAGPVTGEEAANSGVRAGTEIPRSLRRKLELALRESVEELVRRGVIPSGEVLARVLPQMTSSLRAAGIEDPALRGLDAALYRAFRRRRSLLLLDLQKQVQVEELPWVAAIEGFRRDDLSEAALARHRLREVALLAITSFPQALLPNKLLQELSALAQRAEMDLPLVEEIAADIFMGELSPKFVRAAHQAAALLEGSLYARYYEIDFQQVLAIKAEQPVVAGGRGMAARSLFAALCLARAGVQSSAWSVAGNGMLLEQQQILTTQNLAVLFSGLRLREALEDRLEGLAFRCFRWICRRLQVKVQSHHDDLVRLKNSAYAWRQLVFYLSLVPAERLEAFLRRAGEHLESQSELFRKRFGPALRGLERAAQGGPVESGEGELSSARRFLGWTIDAHWLGSIPGPRTR